MDVLIDAFGPLHLVHVRRADVVAQAVAWARAEQTGYWQQGDRPSTEPRLDLGQIDGLVHKIQEHDAVWQSWFGGQGARPYPVTHEELVADRRHREGNPAPPERGNTVGMATVVTALQASREVNDDWVRRYRAEGGGSPPPNS